MTPQTPGAAEVFTVHPGPRNDLVDVPGIRVGHYQRTDGGFLTGTTVVLAPEAGMVAAVDVRGGGPGTRETDLLHPTAAADRVHAIVLTGGSAYGLAAASGVADALGERSVGLRVGPAPDQVVPLVPAAVLFDLGRGGDFTARPGPDFGRAALAAATDTGTALGTVGAGTGALTGGLKGGLGTASAVLPDGTVVAAMVAVNAAGSAVDPRTGELLGARLLQPGDCPTGVPSTPTDAERAALAEALAEHVRQHRMAAAATNTTLAVLATDAALTKAQCAKLAGIGHDGMARALNPVHTMVDGDAVFAVSTVGRPSPDLLGFHLLLTAAADVVTRAIVRAVLAARTVSTSAGTWPGYSDLAPTAVGGREE